MSFILGAAGPQKEELAIFLAKMVQGMQAEPHLAKKTCIAERAGFAYFQTRHAPIDKELLLDETSTILFTARARLDNKPYIAEQCQRAASESDAALTFAAFLKWGKDCVKYLRGDWCFAAQTPTEFFLARDPHGYTALYYFVHTKHLFFSTSPKAIFALDAYRKKMDRKKFLSSLLLLPNDIPERTGYKDLFLLPPAHILQFSNGKISLSRYWHPENIALRHYKNPRQYADELGEIFREAVRVRLGDKVASMLSGGLDSGSVSAVAADLKRQKGKILKTFSHVPQYIPQEMLKHKLLDERINIRSTATFSGNIDTLLLDSSDFSPTRGIVEAVDKMDMAFHGAANAFWMLDICKTASEMQYEALLTGEMGNGSLSFVGIPHQLSWRHPAVQRQPLVWLKENAKHFLKNKLPFSPYSRTAKLTQYVKASYVHSSLQQEALDTPPLPKSISNAQEAMFKILGIGENFRCTLGQRLGDAYSIELRDPTADLNVIEYCLSIPNDAFFDKNLRGKALVKNTMRDVLHKDVLHQTQKGLQASDLAERLKNDRDGVENILAQIGKSAQVVDIFDLNRIKSDWNKPFSVPQQAQHLMKTLMFAYFLSKMDE